MDETSKKCELCNGYGVLAGPDAYERWDQIVNETIEKIRYDGVPQVVMAIIINGFRQNREKCGWCNGLGVNLENSAA